MGLNREALGLTSTWHLTDLPDEAEWCLGDPVSAISRFESKYYLSNTLLRDGDIFGMANSVEIRVPFLDRDLGVRPRIQTSGVVLPGGVKQSEPIMFHGQKLPAILPG